MSEGGGMFQSTDNGDSWTKQNDGFTAFDANAVAFNSVGNVFAAAAGGVFRSTNDVDIRTDISSGLISVGGNVWALAMDSGDYAFTGTAGGGVLRSVRSTTTRDIPKPRPRPTPAPCPECLLIDAGANICAPRFLSSATFGAASNLLREVRITGTRDFSRVPVSKDRLSAGLRAEAEGWDPAWALA